MQKGGIEIWIAKVTTPRYLPKFTKKKKKVRKREGESDRNGAARLAGDLSQQRAVNFSDVVNQSSWLESEDERRIRLGLGLLGQEGFRPHFLPGFSGLPPPSSLLLRLPPPSHSEHVLYPYPYSFLIEAPAAPILPFFFFF